MDSILARRRYLEGRDPHVRRTLRIPPEVAEKEYLAGKVQLSKISSMKPVTSS